MLFAMAARVHGITGNRNKHRICQFDLGHDTFFDINKRNLMVIDDQMDNAAGDKRIVNLFTRGSQHRNLSIIYILQNLFHQGKGSRGISLNSHRLGSF